MARRTARKLKVSDIAFSPTAMEQVLRVGGEILAMRIVRTLQDGWASYPRRRGIISVLKLEVAGLELHCLFPLTGLTGVAVLTPAEAERSKQSILTGTPDSIQLKRLGMA